ncbi:MAG TPA: amino acid deaminase/aldolase [Solirubrobacteraceae bacterium]|jgi:D-serine deaminase-like pyridoxal phosphate-dependent protein
MSEPLERLEAASADLQPPFAVVDLGALWSNAADMERRAAAKRIRLASKSVRCRHLQELVLAREGFLGTLAYTLGEALWLAEHGFSDILVAYPTVDRDALAALGKLSFNRADTRVTIMIDSIRQLELLDAATGPRQAPVRVCLELDAGLWLAGGRVRLGAKRSPVHTPEQAESLARRITEHPGVTLVGVMAYESQVAGVGDDPPGNPARALAIRLVQRASVRELAARRGAAVARVSALTDLEFVNGGGTGSLHSSTREDAVTEIAAGSGLYGPVLFDSYSSFRPLPAAMFALPVVRRPGSGVATALGGGYLASGPGDRARLPRPHLPSGLRLDPREGAGEVQTPLLGPGADALEIGDRVWMRHAKAGELCERFDRLYLIEGDRIVDEVPTYRGEGRCFL